MSEFVVLLLERNNNNNDKKQLCWTIFNNIYTQTREKGMRKRKSRSLYYWLIDESSLYLETERGKHYSSTICFQCFMFAKREVGRSKMLKYCWTLKKKERFVYQQRISSCSFIYTTTIDIYAYLIAIVAEIYIHLSINSCILFSPFSSINRLTSYLPRNKVKSVILLQFAWKYIIWISGIFSWTYLTNQKTNNHHRVHWMAIYDGKGIWEKDDQNHCNNEVGGRKKKQNGGANG